MTFLRCSCGGYIKAEIPCDICKETITKQQEKDILLKLDMSHCMDLYRAGMFESAQIALEKLLQIAKNTLHPHHHLFLDMNVNLVSLCSKRHQFKTAIEYCESAVEQMITIAQTEMLGDFIPELSNLYEKLYELITIYHEAILQNLVDTNEDVVLLQNKGKVAYDRCKEIRKVCHLPFL
jgi:hypothetical protein